MGLMASTASSGQKDLFAPSGARTARLFPGLLFGGILGSELKGRRVPDIHLLDQPTFPARPHFTWPVWPPGPSCSPCLVSLHLCSCCLALEASLQVRDWFKAVLSSHKKMFASEKTTIHC